MGSPVFFPLLVQIFAAFTNRIALGQESSIAPSKDLNGTAAPPTTTASVASEIQKVSLGDKEPGCSGRLRLLISNTSLVTLCPDGFSRQEADVVCRELGCGHVHSIVAGTLFGKAKETLWDQGVECRNNQSKLSECHKVWRQCHTPHRVDIVCSEAHFQLQLVGPGYCKGDVQLYFKGIWYYVSSSSFTAEKAELVCKKLQCGHAVSVYKKTTGKHPTVHVEKWSCLAGEAKVSGCLGQVGSLDGATNLQCSEGEGVVFRLVDGHSQCDGRTEVFHQGSWMPVCSSEWHDRHRELVCSQLQCSGPESRWNEPGTRGKNRTGETTCVKCRSLDMKTIQQTNLWDCKKEWAPWKQMNITCPDPRPKVKPKVTERLSGGVTTCIILAVLLLLLLLLTYSWRMYQRDGKQMFRRKQTQRQWIGPTGAASHAVSFHRNNNANLRPVSTQSADGNLYRGTPQKDSFSAYPALERRANLPVIVRDNSSESDYDFFDTNAQRL
ncbi:scavenger receptor cysteine-rich type 1 protein M130-like [Carcharodon carcharias]|uniref:scavenger receptor cysteine-rich type 1 protein M130-like n=1 Tax=Carcharodon carcharias TaxID=13397 RepID=UPI001B7DE63E|nr:scavenger receptor cysteine-rich type 1 protein M130-like [Carcharodon carcharias]